MESQCHFCNFIDKHRCLDLTQALGCPQYKGEEDDLSVTVDQPEPAEYEHVGTHVDEKGRLVSTSRRRRRGVCITPEPRTAVTARMGDEVWLPWDARFMELAKHVAQWSKDPSTKVGAVIVDAQRRVRGVGYNGFPRGVEDSISRLENREEKYRLVVHAEANAILNSSSTEDCTIYVWPLFSCSTCAGLIIQAGIRRVVTPPPLEARWQSAYDAAAQMYREAGVEVTHINV